MKNEIEFRTISEVRAEGDAGVIEGYIVKWNTVDSYDSTFTRGAFAKTINERMSKIRVLFNHNGSDTGNPSNDVPIGKLMEIREDEIGVFVQIQLIMSIQKASDTFSAIKAEAIDSFSFGFRTIKETFKKGIRVISEVKLFEVSPVIFEANEASAITGVRGMEVEDEEVRATDFSETDDWKELRQRGPRLIESLWCTLDDVWWSDVDDKVANIDSAISEFHAAYIAWAGEVVGMAETRSSEVANTNELAVQFNHYLNDADKSMDELASSTDFNINELRALRSGKTIAAHTKLEGLPEELRMAHKKARSEAAEALISEMRSGIEPAIATRMMSLLKQSEEPEKPNPIVEHLETFSETFLEN